MVRALFAFAALVALISAPALARDRVALLIGNGAYEHTGRLRNPTNDVLAMYALLTSPALGFDGRDVEVVENGDRRAMARAIRRFRQRASQADTALLFFSGHGMEIGGQNYLIPTDAELKHPGDADFDAIPLDAAVAAAASASRLSVVIFDACRNNSFPSTARNGSTGFRMVTPDRPGQVIAFSTAPQEIAFDGSAALSPYTQALTEAIAADPSLDVRKLFTSLGAKTARYAGGPQRPFARFGDLPAEDIALIPA
ncbi:MAG: caspase family protein, partial [Pseudomonadota bacterium]